jgi:glycosyltransferase involved in cell wall biosynthesis
MNRRPQVLMVTGAYFPEMSGAGLQCRALVTRLRDRADFTILTTTTDATLATRDVQDGVPVHRVYVDPTSIVSKLMATVRMTRAFIRARRHFSIVHLHGFSQKSILLVCLSRLARKRLAIKMTSVGHDDPVSMRRDGGLANWAYRRADLFFGIAPRFSELFGESGLPAERLAMIPNGVSLERFHAPAAGERESLRRSLGIPPGDPVILFIGFFSHEKRPDLLFDAWARIAVSSAPASVLVLVGPTQSSYYEIDEQIAEKIRRAADARGLTGRVHFVETTQAIDEFQRAADIFVLPSLREGLPNALLEAMASGCACIVTRLPGVTDHIVDDERSGVLVAPGDVDALERALRRLVSDPVLRASLGAEARRTIETRYSLDRAADLYLDAYRRLLDHSPCAA